jgi:hypothetical protein
VLVLDSDMVFVTPLARHVERGKPVAQRSRYSVGPELADALRPYTSTPEALQPIAVPMLVHRDDLRSLAPLWFELTKQLRSDGSVCRLIPWICEMWACAIAAQRLTLHFRLEQNARSLRSEPSCSSP